MAGQDVLTGTQLPIDAASILGTLGGLQNDKYSTDAGIYSALLNYQTQGLAAARAYDIDLKNYGKDVAEFNFQQRLAAAQNDIARTGLGLQFANSKLGVDTFNFQQRSDVANKKLSILDALANRQGPQDWVGYDSLLNGLNEPNASKSTTIDPFSILNGLDQPANFEVPAWARNAPIDSSTIVQPFTAQPPTQPQGVPPPTAAAPVFGQGAPGAGTGSPPPAAAPPVTSSPAPVSGPGSWAQPNVSAAAPVAPGSGGGANWAGVRNEDVASIKPGQSTFITTGTAGPSTYGDYDANGWDVYLGNQKLSDPTTVIPGGSPVMLFKRLAMGGTVGAYPAARGGLFKVGPVMTGDSVSGRPTGHEEVATVTTRDPNTTLNVQPVNQAGMAAQAATGGTRRNRRSGGTPRQLPGNRIPRPDRGQPIDWRSFFAGFMHHAASGGKYKAYARAATGGSYGTAATDPTLTFNTYDPATLGSQPFIKKLFGGGSPSWVGLGAKLSNPRLGLNDVPSGFNVRNYNDLATSEKAATQNLYNKGLSVDFNDIWDRSLRAAPAGHTYGPTFYGS